MKLLHRIGPALMAYGPWGIFLLALVDSLGVPLPAAMDVSLLFIAAGSAHHPRSAYFAALMAVLGSVAGNIGLFIGSRQGARWLSRGEPAGGRGGRFREWFQRYGLLTVFVPAVVPFIPLPLKVFVVSAGALRTSFGRFLAVIAVARGIRYFGEAWLGLQLGADAQGFLARHAWTFAGCALALCLGLYLLIRAADRRGQAEA